MGAHTWHTKIKCPKSAVTNKIKQDFKQVPERGDTRKNMTNVSPLISQQNLHKIKKQSVSNVVKAARILQLELKSTHTLL
jgi:hypothetical protein